MALSDSDRRLNGDITEQIVAAGNIECAVQESLNLSYITQPNGVANTFTIDAHRLLCDIRLTVCPALLLETQRV
jgi:hypothetical protein